MMYCEVSFEHHPSISLQSTNHLPMEAFLSASMLWFDPVRHTGAEDWLRTGNTKCFEGDDSFSPASQRRSFWGQCTPFLAGDQYLNSFVYSVHGCLLFGGGCQATPKPLALLGLLWTHKKVHLSTIRNGRQPGDVGLDMVGQGFSLALHDDFKLGDPISLKVWFGLGTKTILCWWSTISIHGRLAKYCYVKCHKDTQKLLHLQKWLALQSTEMGMGQYL